MAIALLSAFTASCEFDRDLVYEEAAWAAATVAEQWERFSDEVALYLMSIFISNQNVPRIGTVHHRAEPDKAETTRHVLLIRNAAVMRAHGLFFQRYSRIRGVTAPVRCSMAM